MIDIKSMKSKDFILVLFSLVTLSLLFGSSSMSSGENQKNVFVMSEGDKTPITVEAPREFSIKIKSNPSTGYSWWVRIPEQDEESLVKFKEKKVEEPGDRPEEKRLLGAPTYEIFTFTALRPGESVIELHYRRPWEKDVPTLKKHKICVTIK